MNGFSPSELSERGLRILMISFACSPKRGGEHLLGWEWARRMAERGHEVLVLTRAKYIPESNGRLIPGLQLLPVPDENFKFLRNFGEVGRQIYYYIWNARAAKFAKQCRVTFRPDVVHQCTFHTVRRPCLPALWETTPVIWGPVAGLESTPFPLLPALGRSAAGEIGRKVLTWVQTRSVTIRRCLKAASHVVVSNTDTLRELDRLVSRPYEFLPANAVEPLEPSHYEAPTVSLDVVIVGLLVPMRPFSLLLKALAGLDADQRSRISISFIGDGPKLASLKVMAHRLGLTSNVLCGWLPHCKWRIEVLTRWSGAVLCPAC